ncbi:hypothetical protein KCP75_10200 [Salmonella enterica subsp. enterica]|nr:hypothetical protein KCP75_10200 [Salmonella enterica subsp. enterica]
METIAESPSAKRFSVRYHGRRGTGAKVYLAEKSTSVGFPVRCAGCTQYATAWGRRVIFGREGLRFPEPDAGAD